SGQARCRAQAPDIGVTTSNRPWAEAKLDVIGDAGHASTEPGIIDSLVRATDWAASL
ncbi:MAG: prolyl aminopeptidase, partial [Brevundimonas sp.]|nr:prolyl aminopeptidase [Brevundimonas sp.]